jgi:hypothetical protein
MNAWSKSQNTEGLGSYEELWNVPEWYGKEVLYPPIMKTKINCVIENIRMVKLPLLLFHTKLTQVGKLLIYYL